MKLILVTCMILLSWTRPDGAPPQNCRAVPHQRLEELLPVLPGFVRAKPAGTTDTETAVSRTTVDYEDRAAVISVELMDTCGNIDMLSQLREFLTKGPPPMPGTVTRTLQIKGFPAHEEWTAESQHSEIHIMVEDRFTVKVTGDLVNLSPVQGAAQAIELRKLAALR